MKYALYTTTNDHFFLATYVLIKSFLKNNLWFDGDIKIFSNTKIKEKNLKIILNLYERIYFEIIDENCEKYKAYKTSVDFFKTGDYGGTWPHMLKYEAFRDNRYDRAVYLDSDMLVLGDIKDAFFNDYDFGICYDSFREEDFRLWDKKFLWDGVNNLNSGFISVKNPNENYFNDLIYLSNNFETKVKKRYGGKCVDQEVITQFFETKNVTIFGIEYNAFQTFYVELAERKITSEKIIHYICEQKPWRYLYGRAFRYIHDFWYKELLEDDVEAYKKLEHMKDSSNIMNLEGMCKKGWHVNPDADIVNKILKSINENNVTCLYSDSEGKKCPCPNYILNDKCERNLFIKDA